MSTKTDGYDVDGFRRRLRALRAGPLQLPPRVDPVDWAQSGIIRLPKAVTSRPGKLKLVEWQKEPLQAMCRYLPGINEVVGIKCTQVGWSLIMEIAAIYYLAYEAAKVTIAQPKQDMAQAFAEEDLDPLLERCPAIQAITRPQIKGQTQDKWWLRLYLNGASLRIIGAAANNAFRSYKSRAMLLDEIDDENWQDTSDNGEGDKLKLAEQRTQTFWNSILVKFSTPKLRSSSLSWREWELSDQRRFFMPCPNPSCGHMQHFRFGQLKFTRDDNGKVVDARYQCENLECGELIPEGKKLWMIANGEWRATKVPAKPGLAGYHTNRLMSVSDKAKWTAIGQEWFEAQDDPAKLQTFVNLTLGEPWDEIEIGSGSRDGLAMRVEPYEAEIPAGVKHLVMAVDTNEEGTADGSKNPGLECQIVGFGEGEEAWVIGYAVLDQHDPWSPECIKQLDELRRRKFMRPDGTTLRVADGVTVCDRGAMPNEVMNYARTRWQENVWAIKGANVKKGKRMPGIAPGKPSRNKRTGQTWWTVCTQSAKDLVYRRLRRETPGPGYIHFHEGLDDRYFKGLAAEKLQKLKSGEFHWEHMSKVPNEPWDTLIYCFVGLELAKNASTRLVEDLAIKASRGTGAARNLRHTGPNRGWVHGTGIGTLAKAAITKAVKAIADGVPIEDVKAALRADVPPSTPDPAPAPETDLSDDVDDVKPFWMRRGESSSETTPAPKAGQQGGFRVKTGLVNGRFRR
ncbi:phage terminase large subunit family protein [Microvirga yunnanensis]|uniref:phage terminase large subunit family protein n=1 Tax=Microvirga yunnanensis TaxID=2953740 RepID=UPI0021CAA1A6|nr:phage terminase large subunit family protein [Microvirga sp. HBU67655]